LTHKIFKDRSQLFLVLILSSIPFLIHLYVNIFEGYGYFRDELYYIVSTEHLSFGYVDHPPLSIFILYISKTIFGDSLFAIRLLPALLSGLTVFFTCLMALRLGGKTFSLTLSAAAVILAPVYLAMNSFYSMNSIDIFLWSVSFYLVMLIIKENKTSYWIYLGLFIGLGLMNKIGFLWFEFGFFTGILLTHKRKEFLTVKPYLTLIISFVIFLPYIIWNFQNDFAHLEFIRNASSEKYSGLNITDFIKGQFMNMNPFSVVIWLCGLYYFIFNEKGKEFRIIGIIYLTAFIILIINVHSKSEYLAPAYTVLFAGGSVFIELKSQMKFKWLRFAVLIPLLITGVVIAPTVMPLLKVEDHISYTKNLGLAPSSSEGKKLSELKQFFADMHGWEEMAANVSKVYESLSAEEKQNTLFFAWNYGEASAINFFRNKYPLPEAISSHNAFWMWGYGDKEFPTLIIIGGEKEDYTDEFGSVVEVGIHTSKYAMPYETDLMIFIAKDPKNQLSEVWQRIKHYD